MSQENVQLAQQGYEAFGRGDLEAVGQTFADDVEWYSSDELPQGGEVKGRDDVLGNFAQLPNYWSDFAVEPSEFVDAGETLVIVRGRQRATSKETGASFDAPFVHVFEVSGGKVTRGEFYGDSAKAVKALGG
jgi:ketosteroid isomerase-like protein